MPFGRSASPPYEAEGRLRFGDFDGVVAYRLARDPAQLRPGPHRLRGSMDLDPALAARAFAIGEGTLTLPDGTVVRLKVLAHTDGGSAVYFEIGR